LRAKQNPLPVYEGDLPYIYFAFSEDSLPKIRPTLRLLLARGFRVWFAQGPSRDAAELQRRQRRAKGAALTLLYLGPGEEADTGLKSFFLNNQKAGIPVLVLTADGEDRFLSMNLRENTPALSLPALTGEAALEAALLGSGLLTQDMIGDPVILKDRTRLLPVISVCLAVVLLVLAGLRFFLPAAPTEPELRLSDPVLQTAALAATGEKYLTESTLGTITTLQLDTLPGSWAELERFPALERLILDQGCVTDAAALPSGYVIVLSGGEAG